MTECRKDVITAASVQPYLKVLSCDHQFNHNGESRLPDTVCTTSHQSFIVSLKTDTREGTGSGRTLFLTRITLFTCKVQAARLLPDLHTIIRSLIFPQHIFW
ncbi:hypothetical protein SAMN05428949_6320 [Chitinophaga sp. YR627]|nr:hypothetical protein SAMN05428949_6320 [Chitinophaga sp. YR627]